MFNVRAYVEKSYGVNINQSSARREWMNIYEDMHPYKCLPVVLGNTIGWSISFDEDIEFIWDGITDTSPGHIKVIQGKKYCSLGRANATISFNTGIVFESDEDISLLVLPPSNLFIEGIYPYTAVISPSVLKSNLPIAWRVTSPNKNILIPAKTPVAQVIPISGKMINSTNLEIFSQNDEKFGKEYLNKMISYSNAIVKITMENGKYSNFYKNAINESGEKIGVHDITSFKMNIIDKR